MVKTYTTKLGDTWDIISFLAYGSEMFTAQLVAANWLHRNVSMFNSNVVITLPEISIEQRDNTILPPWRR